MALNTNQEPPIVFETQVSSALDLNDSMRGQAGAMVNHAEAERERIGAILGESGITLESAGGTPDNLGYEQGRFIVLGKKNTLGHILKKAGEVAPDVDMVPKTPLSEALAMGFHSHFVLKHLQGDARGVNKYLINRPNQFEKLQKYSEVYGQWMTDRWSTEPYIETPGGVNSSYRVVVTATGLAIASALIYQPREQGKKAEAPFTNRTILGGYGHPDTQVRENKDRWDNFADRESEWFLDADVVTSNVSTGGSIIPLKLNGEIGATERPERSQKKVLRSHHIEGQETPKDILEASIAIGKGVGPEFALLMGIDFLQDKNGKHYILEINPYPGTDSILTWWGLDPTKSQGNPERQQRISNDLLRVVGSSLRGVHSHDN